MKSHYEIGRIAGISVFAHWSLPAALVALFLVVLWQGRSWTIALDALVLTVTLFCCVVFHEFGHAFMARRFNIRTLHITMYPIGGVAVLAYMPRAYHQELLIALAGPAVNLVIAIVLATIALIQGSLAGFGLIVFENGSVALFSTLAWMNLFLVLFNLIPAFPMDGGRVLRAALASRLSYRTATVVAVIVAQIVAVTLALLAIIPNVLFRDFNPVLLFIAVFVFFAAREEARIQLREPPEAPPGN